MAFISIMQARLGPPENGRSQVFPSSRWRGEFEAASFAGLNGIEWLYDPYGIDKNPLFNIQLTPQMLELSSQYGVEVRSVCADYYMDFPISRLCSADRDKLAINFIDLIRRCGAVGIRRIVLPLLETSSLVSLDDFKFAAEFISQSLPIAEESSVEIHLETDLAPAVFAVFLSTLDHPLVWVTYDTGNSASLGYDCIEELRTYGRRIGSVHVKDRILGGATVALGTGDTDFARIFAGLADLGYQGDFVLQAARSTPGSEIVLARQNRQFVDQLLTVAGLA
jgi:L-ribulose-5-phosphate 3-epimerase